MVKVSHLFKHPNDAKHVAICEEAVRMAEFTKTSCCMVPIETMEYILVAFSGYPDEIEENYRLRKEYEAHRAEMANLEQSIEMYKQMLKERMAGHD